MNWGDIYDNEPRTIWQKIGGILGCIAFIAILWGAMAIANSYEEHKLCMNGAIEHCIDADFQ